MNELINQMNELSNRKAAKSITTYDFLKLYTSIQHEKLLKILNFVIDFSCKSKTENKISINNYGIANR